MMLVPKKMFRAYDCENNRGNLFVLAHKHGPDGKVFWRPDSEKISSLDVFIENIENWEESEVAQAVTRYKEIPIEPGTEQLGIIQVAMDASPSMKRTK
jgi:hypothetical protein